MTIVSELDTDLWNPNTYDGLRRQLIPSFDLLYDSAARAVSLSVPPNAAVLDLGAGTGLLSAAVVSELPDCDLVLYDRSDSMLDRARQRFQGRGRVRTAIGELMGELPQGPFDAVVSALAIHHLTHEEKQILFSRVRGLLRDGGIFVNVEQVLAPTEALERMYDIQHERHVHASGTPEHEWAAGRERMRFDIPIDVETQVGWLRAAGFATADCLAKDWRFAVYAGWARS